MYIPDRNQMAIVENKRERKIITDFSQGMVVRINLALFSTVLPPNSRLFLSCRPFAVITTFSTGLVDVEVNSVSWLGQLTVGV